MIDLAATTKTSLRVDECVEIFGVSRRTIYYWIERGLLIPVDTPDRGWRVDTDSVRVRLAFLTPPGVTGSVQRLHQKTA